MVLPEFCEHGGTVLGGVYDSFIGINRSEPIFAREMSAVGVSKHLRSDGHDDLKDQSVDMDFLGFDWYIRAMDKYAFCDEFNTSRPKDAYGAYLKELNLLELQCLQYGYFSNGSSCSETQVCDSTTVKECGFRCPVPNPVDRKHSVDTWVRKSAEELIRNHRQRYGLGKPWFLQVNFLGPHPPLVADDVLQPEALPKAIDTNFDEVLVFDHSGRGYWVPNLKKHDVNVTEIRLLYAQHLIRIDKEIKILLEILAFQTLTMQRVQLSFG